ncbi:MAG TPA: hypothetical protein VGS11_13570 [Candidatus Bathyarchaeia archaeon]|nr:hypothetical protein [Candidatus Bathyarchaeia archaeon]
MPSELSTIFFASWLLVSVLFSYAAYWAFIIRRALVRGLYRRQASWVVAMGIYFVALSSFLTLAIYFNLNTLAVNILGGAIIGSGFIIIFAWMDTTIRVARRSDPLSRDTLHWSKLRYFLGLVTLGGALASVIQAISSGFSQVAPYGGALFIGALGLLISARRSGDATLRKHLVWTGLCTFFLWLASQAEMPLSEIQLLTQLNLSQVLTFAIVAVGAFSLYKSAKSLILLGHISAVEDAGALQIGASVSTS